MLKGMGVGAIIKLVLAVLVASLFISITTIGSLGQAIQQSFDQIGDATDYTVEVEDKEDYSAEEVLSGLHSFVTLRSFEDGCETIDQMSEDSEGAFPELQGTHLTANPPCFGAESTVIRDGVSLNPLDGWFGGETKDNFMPGIYSREKFEMKQDLELESSGDTAIENSLGTVTDLSLQRISLEVEEHESNQGLLDSIKDYGSTGAVWGLNGLVSSSEIFLSGPLEEVVQEVGEGGEALLQQNMRPTTVVLPRGELRNRTNWNDEVDQANLNNDLNIRLQLCKGDEGYIQSNRGAIDDGSYSGENPIYPVMVIEELGDCEDGTDVGDIGEPVEYEGPNVGSGIEIKEHSDTFGGDTWPKADRFELIDDTSEINDPNILDSNHCWIGFNQNTLTEVSERGNYDTGRIFEKSGDLPNTDDEEGNTMDELFDSRDLSLNGEQIPKSSAGELRVETAQDGYNELYGDMLCANPNGEEYGNWHLCNEGLSNKEIQADGETYYCSPDDGEWTAGEGGSTDEDETAGNGDEGGSSEDDTNDLTSDPQTTGDITANPSSVKPEDSAAISVSSDDEIQFRPEAGREDSVTWNLEEGDKNLETDLSFSKKGEISLELVKENGETGYSLYTEGNQMYVGGSGSDEGFIDYQEDLSIQISKTDSNLEVSTEEPSYTINDGIDGDFQKVKITSNADNVDVNPELTVERVEASYE